MGRFSRLGNDLYSGRKSIDFVGKRRLWYAISGVIIIAAILGLYFKGLNWGLEFRGGAQFTVSLPTSEVTQDNADKLREDVADTGHAERFQLGGPQRAHAGGAEDVYAPVERQQDLLVPDRACLVELAVDQRDRGGRLRQAGGQVTLPGRWPEGGRRQDPAGLVQRQAGAEEDDDRHVAPPAVRANATARRPGTKFSKR